MDIGVWLKEQMASDEAYNADQLLTSFLDEMEKGLSGKGGSLAMIPAYFNTEDIVPPERSVAVIDAGGTNLRICLSKFDADGHIRLSHCNRQPMPGRDKEVTAARFYKILADILEPLADTFETIGFCFSYPAERLPDCDERLLYWTKEIKIPELVGRPLGAGLIRVLEERGIFGKKAAVLNDAAACLLAGMIQGRAFNASSHIGFILGTGTNTAYVENDGNNGRLKKEKAAGSRVINVESGGFSEYERGAADRRLDLRSEHPGRNLFEKSISGVYMGPLMLELLQDLIPKGVFSHRGGTALSTLHDLSTVHINNLAADNGDESGILGTEMFSEADRKIIRQVFFSVVSRTALFAAVNILAAAEKSGAGRDPKRPVCVNINGSTYYKTFRLSEKTQTCLKEMADARGLYVRCIHMEDAPIIGAAIAGLSVFQ